MAWDEKTRAWVMTRDSGSITTMAIELEASATRPLVNPVLVVENWGHDKEGRILVNGAGLPDGTDLRQGVVARPNGVNALIVWIGETYREPTRFEIRR